MPRCSEGGLHWWSWGGVCGQQVPESPLPVGVVEQREAWGRGRGWLGRPEPGRQSRTRLKAPGLYKWILLKWKFPPIPEMSLAARPGLSGLQRLGTPTGTRAKLSKPLVSMQPSPHHPHPLLSPAQVLLRTSHLLYPSHFPPQPPHT